ncbi:MAG: hypothetical protein AB8B70_09210 [Prochlorococcus sp.]|nr:hypothetical protein [Prochlorococcaceae cyanobacterium Fu_MAG_50]
MSDVVLTHAAFDLLMELLDSEDARIIGQNGGADEVAAAAQARLFLNKHKGHLIESQTEASP